MLLMFCEVCGDFFNIVRGKPKNCTCGRTIGQINLNGINLDLKGSYKLFQIDDIELVKSLKKQEDIFNIKKIDEEYFQPFDPVMIENINNGIKK